MDKSILVTDRDLVEAGSRLVTLLDQAEIRPSDVVWMYRPESERWILLLVLPGLEAKGRRTAYEQIARVISAHSAQIDPLQLNDISVIETNETIVRSFRKVLRQVKPPPAIRIVKQRIGDSWIDEAIVLRLQ